MVEPVSVSVVTTLILKVVPLICNAALTARQNKERCSDLAARAKNLGQALPSFAGAAANDEWTAQGLARLNDALGRALKLIKSCQAGGIFHRINVDRTAADLASVDTAISSCLSDLKFFIIVRGHTTSTHGVTPAAQTYDYSSHHHQAQGGAHVAWPPQHASQGYFHGVPGPPPPPPFYPAYPAPPPPFYPASQAPSGSNLSTFYTLPTVKKIFKHVLR